MNGNGGGRAVLLRFLNTSKVDAHASAVNGLDLNSQQGENYRVGEGARETKVALGWEESAASKVFADLDGLCLVARRGRVEGLEVLLATTTHDHDLCMGSATGASGRREHAQKMHLVAVVDGEGLWKA